MSKCNFCDQSFTNATEKNEHILGHFERRHCFDCDHDLIAVGDHWYQLHRDINCNVFQADPIGHNANELFVKTECSDEPPLDDSLQDM